MKFLDEMMGENVERERDYEMESESVLVVAGRCDWQV